MIHFDQTDDDNVRTMVIDHEDSYLVRVTDMDAGLIVGTKRFSSLRHALVYAAACVDGWTPAGTFVNI